MSVTSTREISLTREGHIVRLAFPYSPDLVTQVRTLPYATFDSETKTWTAQLCQQTVQALRSFYHKGLCDTPIDDLIGSDETLPVAKAATLHRGSSKRPYMAYIGIRDDKTYARLKSVVGASWDKKAQGITYPDTAAAALAELVRKGILDDPEGILTRHEDAVVMFDARKGKFVIQSEDRRAQEAFNRHFPHSDVVQAWKDKGLNVAFLDKLSEDMYLGEYRRAHPLPDPDGLLYPLFEYQRRNYSIAVTRQGHSVFDEPGLGKTATGIATGLHLLNTGQVTRVIVIVPAAVRSQWRNEIERFTGHTDIAVVAGDPKQRDAAYKAGNSSRWVIVHYDILARDTRKLTPLFNGSLVVADEAHRIKSRGAARTKALRSLSAGAARRLALTGTPVETNPGEWFEIISGWASPGSLGSSYEFNERYRWKNRWGGYEGARNIPELKERTQPWYSRHTKSQVAQHLPPLRVQQQILDPAPTYAAALKRAHADAVEEISRSRVQSMHDKAEKQGTLLDENEVTQSSDGAHMTAVGLLRALCTSPRIVEESDSPSAETLLQAGLIPDDDGPKLDYVRQLCADLRTATAHRREHTSDDQATPQDVNGERVVIFTYSERMARLTAQRLTEDGVPNVLFTGNVNSADRDAAVKAFTDPHSDVCAFIATDAGAEGLNLGKCCSLLVNVDLAWTASRMAQRAQRIHRIDGTADRYRIINLTIAGTIEAGIVKLLESRADLSDALFGEHGGRSRTTGRRTASLYHEVLAAQTPPNHASHAAAASTDTAPTPPASSPAQTSSDSGEGEQLALGT